MNAVICGGVALDDIILPDIRLNRVPGGSALYASLAGSLFTEMTLGGIVGRDFPKKEIERLRKKRINLDYLQRSTKKTFRWVAKYSADLSNVTVINQQMNAFADFDADSMEGSLKRAKAVFISNIDPEIQLNFVKKIPQKTIKLLDSMDIWMIEKKDVLKEVLKYVDIFFLSEKEAPYLVENNGKLLYHIVDEVMSCGPKVLIIKKGEYGLSMYGALGTFSLPSYPLTHVVDPSGAGDSLGGAMAGIIARLGVFNRASIRTALLVANVVASFVVEGYAAEKLYSLRIDEVINRTRLFLSQLPTIDEIMLNRLNEEKK